MLISTRKNTRSFLLLLVFSSTKLEKRAEQFLPGSEGCRGRERGPGARDGKDPNTVCTYEYTNKEKKKFH
jgi:hypothetical protein